MFRLRLERRVDLPTMTRKVCSFLCTLYLRSVLPNSVLMNECEFALMVNSVANLLFKPDRPVVILQMPFLILLFRTVLD